MADFASTGVAPNYDQIVEMLMASMANPQKPFDIPNLPQPTPLVPQQQMQQLVGRALNPESVQISPTDKSAALAKIGLALMQPRQPGQSVAGSISNAVGGGIDALQAGRDRAKAQAVQQAQLASTLSSADLQRQQSIQAMEIARAKYPGEMARFQQEYNNLVLQGDINAAHALKAKFETAVLAHTKKQADEKAQADLNKVKAETGMLKAHEDAYKAAAEASREGGKFTVTRGDDGTLVTTVRKHGTIYQIETAPPITDPKVALKKAEEQLKAEFMAGKGWVDRLTTPNPSPEEIKQRALELQKPRTTVTDLLTGKPAVMRDVMRPEAAPGVTPPTPGTPRRTADTEGFPTETPEQRREAAKQSIEKIKSDMPTDPVERAAAEREIKRLELIASAENPHQVGKARKPESVYKPQGSGTSSDPIKLTGKPGNVRLPSPIGSAQAAPTSAMPEGEETPATIAANAPPQVVQMKQWMARGVLTAQERMAIRRIAMQYPQYFTEAELSAAGVALPPKKS